MNVDHLDAVIPPLVRRWCTYCGAMTYWRLRLALNTEPSTVYAQCPAVGCQSTPVVVLVEVRPL